MGGQRIGYVPASSFDQNPDRQLEAVLHADVVPPPLAHAKCGMTPDAISSWVSLSFRKSLLIRRSMPASR